MRDNKERKALTEHGTTGLGYRNTIQAKQQKRTYEKSVIKQTYDELKYGDGKCGTKNWYGRMGKYIHKAMG
jgi:hypothetical protein